MRQNIITPVSETTDLITIKRNDWEGLLDKIEDFWDRQAIERSKSKHEGLTFSNAESRQIVLEGQSVFSILRGRKNLSQRALARKAGISPSYLCDLENGKKDPSLKTLKKLAEGLNISFAGLAELLA